MSTITWIGRIVALVEKQAFDLSKITPAPKPLPTDPSKNITQSVGEEPLQYPEHLRIRREESYSGPPVGGTMTHNDHIQAGRELQARRRRAGVPRQEYSYGGADLGTPQGRAAISNAGLTTNHNVKRMAKKRWRDYGLNDFINANTDKVPSTAEQEQSIPWAQQLGGALGRMVGGGASPNAATRNVIQNKTQGAR
jgi:hypothetical protein